MKQNDILSKQLPEIDESVKECVNLGQWLLFKADGHDEVAFYLKTGSSVFELSDSGKVLQKVDNDEDSLEIGELFYFADLPRPRSLSNYVIAGTAR
ncbi:hypothetical protein [Paraburkholderia saeva]|uniref:hypothetical protein n=1 Tax=Paraburkholderia saeva TaxID=2777537 RepID=UPI001E0CCFC2|nr:hypothetical protein [Paraburkholderia saeva]CAG4895131.1 hypothetical protein R52603_01955 [Paraburkholderia saeva]